MIKNQTLSDFIASHCSQSLEMALLAERYPEWKLNCPELTDSDFIRLGLMRCLTAVDSGRHFLQNRDEIFNETIPTSTYFNALKSLRRAKMLEALEQQSYQLLCEILQAHEIDYLKSFPELDGFLVEAADGHFVEHACHTKKGNDGKVYAAGVIYALNLRYGLLRPLCTITNGTQRHQEIPVLRAQLEKDNKKQPQDQSHLYIYDKAATDYGWWDQQIAHDNYMISVLKENASATLVREIPFDKTDEVNTGIEGYGLYKNNQGIQFSLVTYRDPETKTLYQFISTLPESIRPGVIAILYFKRWTIEKAFNNSKSDFKETKAWSSKEASLKNQMRFTTIGYNLMRVFEEVSKQQHTELIHPSDKKYRESLNQRQKKAEKLGCFVNPLLFQPRIARISSKTIRAAQNAIMTGRLMTSFIKKLTGYLVPRVDLPVEH